MLDFVNSLTDKTQQFARLAEVVALNEQEQVSLEGSGLDALDETVQRHQGALRPQRRLLLLQGDLEVRHARLASKLRRA